MQRVNIRNSAEAHKLHGVCPL